MQVKIHLQIIKNILDGIIYRTDLTHLVQPKQVVTVYHLFHFQLLLLEIMMIIHLQLLQNLEVIELQLQIDWLHKIQILIQHLIHLLAFQLNIVLLMVILL